MDRVDTRSRQDHRELISSAKEEVMRPMRPGTERSKPGEAVQEKWPTPHELAKLRALIATSKKAGDLHTWRRARAVLGYIKGKSVLKLVEELDVVRASVNNWIRWYLATGTESLKPRKAPGAAPKLSEEQRAQLVAFDRG
jgi:Winged helix-turn helix